MGGIGPNLRRGSRPFVIAGIVLALLYAAGCGRGKDGAGGPGGAGGPEGALGADALAALRGEAIASRDKAVSAGAKELAAAEFARAQDALDGAQRAYDMGQDYQARSGFANARVLFGQALETAEKAKRARRDAEADRDSALLAKKRAEEAKAAELLPEGFRSAEDQLKAAERDFADPARAANSRGAFQRAAELFEQLAQDAKKAEAQRNRAIREREEVAKNRKSAEEAGAKEYVPVRWEEAEQLLRDAEGMFAEARFDEAVELFKDCSRLFLDALRNTRDLIALKKAAEESAVPEAEREPLRPGERPGEKAEEEEEPKAAAPAPPPDDADASIRAHVDKIFAVETNYTNGIVDLDYAQGAAFEKDCIVKVGSPNLPKFTGQLPGVAMANIVYTFAGIGGTGQVIHKAIFEDEVEVTFDTKMEMIKPGPPGTANFRIYLMYDAQAKTYYGSDFGTALVISGRQRSENVYQQAALPEFRKNAYSWFDRFNVHPIAVGFAWSEADGTGRLTASFSDKAKNEFVTKLRLSGRVGFEWKECRFYLQKVRIRGRLERKWLFEELGKLGVKVPAAGAPQGGKKEGAAKGSGLDF